MRKIVIVSVCLIAFASCKKEYTCTCETTDSNNAFEPQVGSYVIKATKVGANDSCDSGNKVDGTVETVCKLN